MRIRVNPNPFKYWFRYIGTDEYQNYEESIRSLLDFRYPFIHNLARLRSARSLAKPVRDKGLFTYHRVRQDRPLMKDPTAFFSSEWLAKYSIWVYWFYNASGSILF